MRNIAIVADSSVSFTPEQAQEYGVILIPLTIIHNNKEYLDQVDLNYDDVNEILRKKERIQTSQPNLGMMIDTFTKIESSKYDHVFVVSVSSVLSGTFSSIHGAIEESGLTNYNLIDSYSICGIPQQIIKLIRKLNNEDASIEEILEGVSHIIDNTAAYVYPETLDQLKLSGRISRSAATMASLLKIKPILKLENRGTTIEKFATVRTFSKVVESIINDMNLSGVRGELHDIYILQNEAKQTVEAFTRSFKEKFNNIQVFVVNLPAVLAAHGGIGTVAIQWCPKI